jgi:hypothetical protein
MTTGEKLKLGKRRWDHVTAGYGTRREKAETLKVESRNGIGG